MSSREIIQPHKSDKRYVRRDEQGHFTEHQVNGDRGDEAKS